MKCAFLTHEGLHESRLNVEGADDTLGIQVLSKNGGMWFSSAWSGTKTVEQVLEGGNLAVH